VRAIDHFTGNECLANRTRKLKWQDRISGQWMEYERVDMSTLQFRLARYGDKNNITVSLAYDEAGQLTEIRDHHNQPVLQYLYTGGRLSEIRDVPNTDDPSPARVVKYGWGTSTINGQVVPVINQVTDVLGNLTQYTIVAGQLQTLTDPEGRIRKYAYTADRVTSYTDGEGKITKYVYDYDKLKREFYVRITSPNGTQTENWYDSEGQLIRRDNANQTTYKRTAVDTVARSETRADAAGRQTILTRDEYGNLVKTQYPDGSSTSAKYSAVHGQIIEETDELGIKTRYDYDPKGNLLKKTEALGQPEERITEYEVDAYGQVTRMTRKGRTESNGTVTSDATWQLGFDLKGNITQTTDPEGKLRHRTYDRRGNELAITDPLGQIWRTVWDAADQVTDEIDPLGHVARTGYDKVGNLISETDPLGKAWRVTYDNENRPLKRINPLGNEYTTQYDGAGRLAQVVDASGKRMQMEYDAQQRLAKATDGKGQVFQFDYTAPDGAENVAQAVAKLIYPTFTRQYRFDARGRPQQRADLDGAEGRVTQYTHDGAGRQKTLTDANGKTRYYDYDAFGDLVQAKDPLGNAMRLLRDTRGNVIAVTDPRGNTTRLAYDRRDLLTATTDPLGHTTRYTYDDNGRLTEILQANGQKVIYVYDAADHVTEHREYTAAGALQKTTAYTYDDADNLIGWSDGNVSATRSYDDAGRLLAETIDYGNFALTHRSTWHGNNQIASHTGPDNRTVTYDYDEQGQLQTLIIPGEGSLSVTDWHWFAPKKTLLPGGTEQRMDYNGYGELKQLKVVGPTQTVLFELQNQYGQLAELKTTSRDGSALSYTYDDAQRLTAIEGGFFSGKNESFQVDAASNRIQHNRAGSDIWNYDAANQLTARGPISYQYDAAGNQVKKEDSRLSEPARTTHYAYDAFNRLTEITDGAGQRIARYTYDPFDRRLSKTLGLGATGQTVGVTHYLQSDWGLLAEADGAGKLQTVYGWHPSRDNGTGPVYARIADGDDWRTVYYHNDQLGTPQRVTDKAGNLVWAADYDGFGKANVREIENGIVNNLRYPGQYEDAETKLHYNDRRYYDPDTGRYITRDPIGFEGGINLYTYAGHNPINYTDPTGEFIPLCIAANYLRCMAVCTLISTASDYFLNCQNIRWGENLKDCAVDCLLSLIPIPDPCGRFGKMFSAAVGVISALNSFPADTLVQVKPANATPEDAKRAKAILKPIGELKPGDEVLALAEWKDRGNDVQTDQRLSYEKVQDIFTSHREQTLVHITLDNGETLTATDGHPFKTTEGWRDAILLKKGRQLLLKGSSEAGAERTATIASIDIETKTLPVFNLEVANAHTFFVGEEGVLVHNAKGAGPKTPPPNATPRNWVPPRNQRGNSWAGEFADTPYSDLCNHARTNQKAAKMKKLMDQRDRLFQKSRG
jgi:RHS repeat-associated protein